MRKFDFVKLIIDGDVKELIFICSLFISVHSTVIMDAFLMKRPVMLINEFEEFMPYSELTDIEVVKDLSKLNDKLNYCLTDDYTSVINSYSRFVKSYLNENKDTSKEIKQLLTTYIN